MCGANCCNGRRHGRGRGCAQPGGALVYDILVLAAGAEALEPDPPELGKVGFNLYSPEGSSSIRGAIETFARGEITLLAVSNPFKCPAALYEAALMLWSYFVRYGRGRDVRLSVYTPEEAPLAAAGARPSRVITRALAVRGITLHVGQRLGAVDPAARRLRFAGGSEQRFDLLIYIPRHHCPEAVMDSGLTDTYGWVPVDALTLRTSAPDIYAIGDVNRIRLVSGHDMFKMGEAAHFQGLVVADNIAAQIGGRKPKRLFGGKLGCIIEAGNTAIPMLGNLYRRRPNLLVLPSSRSWRILKLPAEWQWLREHS